MQKQFHLAFAHFCVPSLRPAHARALAVPWRPPLRTAQERATVRAAVQVEQEVAPAVHAVLAIAGDSPHTAVQALAIACRVEYDAMKSYVATLFEFLTHNTRKLPACQLLLPEKEGEEKQFVRLHGAWGAGRAADTRYARRANEADRRPAAQSRTTSRRPRIPRTSRRSLTQQRRSSRRARPRRRRRLRRRRLPRRLQPT